jgi:hypothetical protein
MLQNIWRERSDDEEGNEIENVNPYAPGLASDFLVASIFELTPLKSLKVWSSIIRFQNYQQSFILLRQMTSLGTALMKLLIWISFKMDLKDESMKIAIWYIQGALGEHSMRKSAFKVSWEFD